MKRTLLLFACLTIPLVALLPISSAKEAIPDGISEARILADDENVAFNKSSLKYHCRTCTWAKRCTENCVTITKAEAIKRGGVACKICGGSCR